MGQISQPSGGGSAPQFTADPFAVPFFDAAGVGQADNTLFSNLFNAGISQIRIDRSASAVDANTVQLNGVTGATALTLLNNAGGVFDTVTMQARGGGVGGRLLHLNDAAVPFSFTHANDTDWVFESLSANVSRAVININDSVSSVFDLINTDGVDTATISLSCVIGTPEFVYNDTSGFIPFNFVNSSGGGFTFGGDRVATIVTGTWTPVDDSGAGLVFTAAEGIFQIVGEQVILSGRVEYPVTADASAAVIGGFPFIVDPGTLAAEQGCLSFSTTAGAAFFRANSNTDNGSFFSNAGVAVANSVLSAGVFNFQVIYQQI